MRDPDPDPHQHFEIATTVRASQEQVWAWITDFRCIRREMMPVMRMTVPRDFAGLTPETVVPGQRLFRSWIFLGGLLPFDWSDLTLETLAPGAGFVERSPMGSMRHWQHWRWITPAGRGCTITDTLTFAPRFATPLASAFVKAFFRHRHRRLRRFLGSPDSR